MTVGVLQLEVTIGDSMSLKDKRRVIKSIKDRIAAHQAEGLPAGSAVPPPAAGTQATVRTNEAASRNGDEEVR